MDRVEVVGSALPAGLRSALARRPPGDGLQLWSWRCPKVEAWRLLSALPDGEGSYLATQEGQWATAGVVRRVRAQGPSLGRTIAEEVAPWLARIPVGAEAGLPPPRPRLYGVMGFELEPAGSADFVLPRWRYDDDGDGPRLTLTLGGEDRAPLEAELRAIEGAFAAKPGPPNLPRAEVRADPPGPFLAAVEAATTRLSQGVLQKVVLSRDVVVQADAPLDGLEVLRRLPSPTATGATYGRRTEAGWFLGATPELLVARRGSRIESMALAGTAPAGRDPDVLLASAKDRAEHRWVVEQVAARLHPVADLEVPKVPSVLSLTRLLHLHTPITGTLRAPLHVLALADRLHPTPAVAGLPEAEALRTIAELERRPRGLYAGAIGYFDAMGDGAFYVGLRAATLVGATARCHVGVGLVVGSIPALEWAETEWKAAGMLEALGVHRG